ncbi:hypothetical protein HN412_03750 [archaeon]|jgi:hypothetical protein|nr:hypothetical protein [archaeon]MBT7192671.1 hypothetical protein [archaeon]MBT7297853.1 hypothetical protein [archaeon]
MDITIIKDKLFEKSKQYDFALFNGLPYTENQDLEFAKFKWEGSDIESYLDFAHRLGIKIVYYKFAIEENKSSQHFDKPKYLMAYFKFNDNYYRFCWMSDWFANE